MNMDQNRLEILKKVEKGGFKLEEASEQLSNIEGKLSITDEKVEVIPAPDVSLYDKQKDINKEKPSWSFILWVTPLILGIILTIYSSSWLYQNYLEVGLGFKFWLTWIPFLIGVFFIYFGWMLQRARWIHINIRQQEGQKPKRIFLAFPLPFQLIGFILNIFKGKMGSQVSNFDMEELLVTIDQQIKKDEPFYVQVDEDDGTKVEIYIG